MKKLGLVSLAAAVALSTSAMAEEVKYSGKLYIEQTMNAVDAGGSEYSYNNYEIDLDVTAKKKISDNFSATVTVQADADHTEGSATMGTTSTGAANQNLNVEEATFTYNTGALTVTTGLQAISTPNTDGENGAGIFATYGLGNVTLAAASYIDNDIVADAQITAAAALGSVGAVSYQLWHIDLAESAAAVDTMNTVIVGGKVGPVALSARYATTDYYTAGSKDGSTLKIGASGTLDNGVALRATYLSNDKDGAAFTTDPTSSNTIELVYITAKNLADTKVTHLGATFPVAGTSVAVDYAMADIGSDEASELVLKASKGLAKGLTGTLRYAMYNQDIAKTETDKTQARYDLTYKF